MKKLASFLFKSFSILLLIGVAITSKPIIDEPVRIITSGEDKFAFKSQNPAGREEVPEWVKEAVRRYACGVEQNRISSAISWTDFRRKKILDNSNADEMLVENRREGSHDGERGSEYTFAYDVRVNSQADQGQIQPAICTGQDGIIYVAWVDSVVPGGHTPGIYFSKSTDGGVSFIPRVLVDPNGPNIRPSIAVFGTGSSANVYIAYSYVANAENMDYDIYYAVSRNGGTSWAIRGLATSDRFEGFPDIAVDNQNYVYIAYTFGYNRREGCWDFEPEVDIVLRVSPDAGTTFRGAIWVADDEGHVEMHPSIAVTGSASSSVIHIAYDYDVFGNETDYDVRYRKVYNAGSTYPSLGPSTPVGPTSFRDFVTNSAIAIGSDSNPHIVYVTNTGGGSNWDVYYCRSTNGGGSFSVRIPVAIQPYTETDATIALDSYNNPFIAWVDYRSGHSDIFMKWSNDGGASFGPEIKVNRDETSYNKYWPEASCWKDGERRRIDVVWWDTRYNAGDIYYNGNLQYHLGLNIQAVPDTIGMGTIPLDYYSFDESRHLDLRVGTIHLWYDPEFPSSPLLGATSTGSGENSRWYGQPSPSGGWNFVDPNWWDPPEGGNYTVTYYHQYLVTFQPQRASGCPHTLPNTPLSFKRFGSNVNTTVSDAAPVISWVDAGSNWAMGNPINLTPTERWISPGPVSGTITSPTRISPLYYHQWRPLVFLTGPSDTNYVWTESHYQMGVFHPDSHLYNSFQDWTDCGSYLDFSDTTSLGWSAVDSTRFFVTGYFNATIHYASIVRITVQNSFGAGEVIVDGVRYPSPFIGDFGPGTNHTIAAVSPQTFGDSVRYVFTSWSDGGDSAHTITVPLYAFTYTANFSTQYRLTMSYEGPTGGFTPALVGEGWYNDGSAANIGATAGFDSIDGVRYGFSRWTSEPDGATFADSFANETIIFMTRSYHIIAHYAVQYRLIVNNPEGYDAPVPPAGINWRDANSTVICYASPDTARHMYPVGYAGTGSVPSGSGNSVTFVIRMPSSITWLWGEMVSLEVYSEFGAPTPPVGTNWYPPGSHIIADANSPVDIAPGIRAVAVGYEGSGSCPTDTGSHFEFVITTNSTLTWRWTLAYRFTVLNPGGYDAPVPPVGEYWYLAGTRVQGYVSSPDGSMYCIGYTGTGSLSSSPMTSFSFIINSPSSVRWNWAPFSDIVSLTVNSPYGDPRPAGTVYYLRGSLVTALVTSPYYPPGDSGTRYICTGFTGTGSAPASGSDTIAIFTINTNSTLTWHWRHQYRFVVNNPGDWDNPTPPVGTYWYDPGTVVSGSADASVGDSVFCRGYTGTGSLTSDTTNHFSFIINSPSSVTWNWMTRVFTLNVYSDYGNPAPPVGSHRYSDGARLTASVEPMVSLGDGIRAICTGWVGSGSVPASGDTNVINFVLRADSEIRWQWKVQYRFIVENPGGQDNPQPPVGEYWYDSGTIVSGNVDTSDGIWYCVGFEGRGSLVGLDGYNYFSFTIESPSSVRWLWEDLRNICRLMVYSDYGNPFPAPGMHYYRFGTLVTAYAQHYYYADEGSRYALRGFEGTGSVPRSGTDTTVTFRILGDSSIRWNWRSETRLVVNNPGGYDDPYPPAGTYWFQTGAEIYAYVTSPVDSMYCVGYDATGAIESGDGTSVTFSLTVPTTLSWIWMGAGSVVPLEVISPYGRPYPIVGTTHYPFGTTIHAYNDSVYNVSETERWRCVGFRGSGSVPDSGTTNYVDITLRRPSRIEWLWNHQYRITLEYYGTGSFVPRQMGAGWYDDGAVAAVSTEPFVGDSSTRYGFSRWTSNPDGAAFSDITSPTTSVIVNQSYALQANYGLAYLCRVKKIPSEDTLGIIIVDGISYARRSSIDFYWAIGSTHTITVSRIDSSFSTQYRFVRWSTGSTDTTIRVVVTGATDYVASYDIYYMVRINVFPSDVRTIITIGRDFTVRDANYAECWANASLGIVFVEVGLMAPGRNPEERFVFRSWSDGGEIGHYAIFTGPLALSAQYGYQYHWIIRKEPEEIIGNIIYNDTTFTNCARIERWLDEGVSFNVSVTTPDISRDSVYTFTRWSDGGALTHRVGPVRGPQELIAYYNAEPIRVDFSVMPSSWNAGSFLFSETRAMAFGEEIRIVNEGNISATYLLAIDTTGASHWRPGCTSGFETYMVRAQFNSSRPSYYSTAYDCVKSSYTAATSTIFGPEGFNVPTGGVQKLWLCFTAPSSSTYYGLETIRLIIMARPSFY